MWQELRVHPRASVRLAMLKLGSSTTIELLEYKVPTGEATTTAPRNSDHSAAHIGLRVRDVEARRRTYEAFRASRSSRGR